MRPDEIRARSDDPSPQADAARDNGITALRLFLALYILIVHAWPIGGFGRDPIDALTEGRLGGGGVIAVAAFFGLSGYLLVASRRRQGTSTFVVRRAARIFPAYGVLVVATSIVVGHAYMAAAWFPAPGVGGITSIALQGHPSELVNASLWTLWPELCCYALVAVIPPGRLPRVLPIVAMILVLMALIAPESSLALTIVFGPTSAFLFGAALAVWQDRIPLTWSLGIAGLVVAFLSAGSLWGSIAVHSAFAYVAILVGLRLRLHWRVDLSYGTYLFAFPITQGIVAIGGASWGPLLLATLTLAITLPLAALSWYLIESPVLRISRRGMPASLWTRRSSEGAARA